MPVAYYRRQAPRSPAQRTKLGVRLVLSAILPLSQSRTVGWWSLPASNRVSGLLVPRMTGISQILADAPTRRSLREYGLGRKADIRCPPSGEFARACIRLRHRRAQPNQPGSSEGISRAISLARNPLDPTVLAKFAPALPCSHTLRRRALSGGAPRASRPPGCGTNRRQPNRRRSKSPRSASAPASPAQGTINRG